jgi:predicted CXXCH cytochrome family protein
MDPLFSHPVGVSPSMKVPDELPLENGRMTCLTCHQGPHPAISNGQVIQSTGSMLRDTASGNLCLECHTDADANSRKTHGIVSSLAHLKKDTRARSGVRLAGLSRGVDRETETCLSCHDGTIARDASGGVVGNRMVRRTGSPVGKDHPVGVAYNPSTSRLRELPLKPLGSLDPRIRLPEGQVGCGSCHSVYSNQKSLLIMSNHGSALCLSCHQG